MSQNSNTSTDSSESSSSSENMPTWAVYLLTFGWIPALLILYFSGLKLVKSLVHLKRRIFGGPLRWEQDRECKAGQQRTEREERRASGMRLWQDLDSHERWEVFRGRVKAWCPSLSFPTLKFPDLRLPSLRRNKEMKGKRLGVDGDSGVEDIDKQSWKDSESTDVEMGDIEKGFDNVSLDIADAVVERTSASSYTLSFLQWSLTLSHNHKSPQSIDFPADKTDSESQAKAATEEAQATFDREYEALIQDVRPKCASAARVLEAKTPEERARMDLGWIKKNKKVWHKCAGTWLGYAIWCEPGVTSRAGQCEICKA